MELNSIVKTKTETIIRLAEESDTKKILDYLEENSVNKFTLSKKLYINTQISDIEHFRDLNIRNNIYNFYEDYILAERNGKIETLISLGINKRSMSQVYLLNLIICKKVNREQLKNMFQLALEVLPEYSIIDPTKIRASFEEGTDYVDLWKNILQEVGFTHEAKRENELGEGKALTTMIMKFANKK